MKKILTFILLLSAVYCFAQPTNETIIYEGIERDYLIYLPANYQEGVQWPLVFNLHGYGSNAAEQYLYTAMSAVADTANFILCTPNATANGIVPGNGWNVGFPFATNTADDVGFIDTLIDVLHAEYNINMGRVYSCGMSNGGFMSYKLACELTDRIQAVASVTGSMVQSELNNCMASSTIPTMQIHGTEDPTVAYEGSGFNVGIEDLVSYWVEHNECSELPDTTFLEESPLMDNSSAQLITYTDCNTDREVLFYKIIGGEHTWPGAAFTQLGITNQDFSASAEIWNFFNKYGEDLPPLSNNSITNSLNIAIHPNPTLDQLTIESEGANLLGFRIFNSTGQLISNTTGLSNKMYTLTTYHLNTGLYFIDIQTEKGHNSQTFIKQ